LIGGDRGEIRAKVLPFDEVNAANPIEGYVARTTEPTPLESDMHHTFEVGILLAGQEERHFEGLTRLVEAGDVWWAAAWEPHGWRTTAPPSDELVIHFVPELLGDAELDGISWLSFFAAPPHERPVASTPETRRRVLALGGELAQEFRMRRWAWRDRARYSLLSLLVTMGRESGLVRENWRWSGSPTGGLARIMPAIELVHNDLGRRLPLRAAAGACGLSPSRFRALFSTTMGMAYSRFERRARLAYAARLLLGTDGSVESIGEQTGFTDGSHLHRAFLKHYGCTPTEFRVQGRQIRSRGDRRAGRPREGLRLGTVRGPKGAQSRGRQ
jgi:AraC-like DNA-binding protein